MHFPKQPAILSLSGASLLQLFSAAWPWCPARESAESLPGRWAARRRAVPHRPRCTEASHDLGDAGDLLGPLANAKRRQPLCVDVCCSFYSKSSSKEIQNVGNVGLRVPREKNVGLRCWPAIVILTHPFPLASPQFQEGAKMHPGSCRCLIVQNYL